MSNLENELLFERAAKMVDYWDNTQIADRIELCLEQNDLDELRKLVLEAEAVASQEELEAYDVF